MYRMPAGALLASLFTKTMPPQVTNPTPAVPCIMSQLVRFSRICTSTLGLRNRARTATGRVVQAEQVGCTRTGWNRLVVHPHSPFTLPIHTPFTHPFTTPFTYPFTQPFTPHSHTPLHPQSHPILCRRGPSSRSLSSTPWLSATQCRTARARARDSCWLRQTGKLIRMRRTESSSGTPCRSNLVVVVVVV